MKIICRLFLCFCILFWLPACDNIDNNSNAEVTNTDSSKAENNSTISFDCQKLNGSIFRYKEPAEFADLPDDSKIPDSVQYTIVFNCENDSLKALMFGPDPEGEHGLFYFNENLDSLNVNNGIVSFSLVQRKLYLKPYTLNNYNKGVKYEVRGGSSEIQFFKGKLAGDSILFTCNSELGTECYDDTMVFKKISFPRN